MSRLALEVADIFRASGPAYRAHEAGHLSLGQLRVMSAIEACRTAALGGHVMRCEDCAHIDIAYNSCRNRHCPKCQAAAAYDKLRLFGVTRRQVDELTVRITIERPYAPSAIDVPTFLPDLPAIRKEMAQYYTSTRRAGSQKPIERPMRGGLSQKHTGEDGLLMSSWPCTIREAAPMLRPSNEETGDVI